LRTCPTAAVPGGGSEGGSEGLGGVRGAGGVALGGDERVAGPVAVQAATYGDATQRRVVKDEDEDDD